MKERIITIFLFLIIVTSSFFFGYPRLVNFSGVDEPYWSYDRVPKFWNAISEMKWKNTNLCDKPGIPLAIVSGAGLPFIGEDPRDFQKLRYEPKNPEEVQQIRDIYFWLRLPVFLFTLAVLPLFYFLIKKLLGKPAARFAILFIGLSPILLGISLIVNSDSMLWILSGLSTLSFFVFLKNSEKKYLILSGFFLGLSVITKYVANILFVYFFLLFFLEYIFFQHQKIPVYDFLKKALKNYFLLVLTAMVTAFAFFPATWVDFSKLIKATIGNEVFSSTWPLFASVIGLAVADALVFKSKFSGTVFGYFSRHKKYIAGTAAGLFFFLGLLVFLHVYANLGLFDLQGVIASPKGIGEGGALERYSAALTADVYSLLFSLSPLVLFFALFSVFGVLRKRKLTRESVVVVYLLLFLFFYYLGSAVNDVIATVRYQIVAYPLIFVVAAIGASRFFEQEKIKKYFSYLAAYAVVAIFLLASLWNVKPHFLAYASEILPSDFIVNLKGMGEGSIEAAQYLNTLPEAQNMTIWSDKGAVCEAYAGKCFIDFKRKTFTENNIEYFVVSTDRRSRTLKLSAPVENMVNFKEIYSGENPDFEIIIGNNPNNFVKVFKAEEFLRKNEN